MPQRINVVRLSDEERAVLRHVTSGEEMKAVKRELSVALRVGGDTARSAAQSMETSPEKFTQLRDDLTNRLETLTALPVDETVKAPLIERTREALRIAEEGLRMLEAAD